MGVTMAPKPSRYKIHITPQYRAGKWNKFGNYMLKPIPYNNWIKPDVKVTIKNLHPLLDGIECVVLSISGPHIMVKIVEEEYNGEVFEVYSNEVEKFSVERKDNKPSMYKVGPLWPII